MKVLFALFLTLALFVCLVNCNPYKGEPTNEDEETELTGIVHGYVYCQDCHGRWNKSSSAALVGVQCKVEDGSVTSYGEGYSGEDGYFHIKFSYDFESVYDGTKFCKAVLMASPDSSCNTITNVGEGRKGGKLKFDKVFMGEVYFSTGPFALMPYCPKDSDMAPPSY